MRTMAEDQLVKDQIGVICIRLGQIIACEHPELLTAFQPEIAAGILWHIRTYFGTEIAQNIAQCIQDLNPEFATQVFEFIPKPNRYIICGELKKV